MYFAIDKIANHLQEIRSAIYREKIDIAQFKFFNGDCLHAEAPGFDDHAWDNFRVGELWGGYDRIAWFRAYVDIPPAWRSHTLRLRFLVGPRDGAGSTAETQLYVNGFPLQGIDVWHEEAWLPPEFASLPEISIALRAWSGMYRIPPQRRFKEARLVWVDEQAECFYYQADTLLKAIKQLDENDLRRVNLLNILNRAFLKINFLKPRSTAFYQSIQEAAASLSHDLAGLQILETKPTVNAIGHSHIDMAWMWQSRHTREKARRTFSTMLNLMRQFPEFRYVHSTPQLYKFIKQDDPALYERVKEQITNGRWEVAGGSWVEMDTNIPGSESLVRQILFGKRFARQEFGLDCKVLWMPDTFGFSWVLPQLMKKSGLEYFASSAIHWSRFNRFPHDTFHWRGMDGSEVLVTFFTAPGETIKNHYNYNGLAAPYDVKVAWEHYREKEFNQELLMPFGWGDGGGGPTPEMIQSIHFMENIPGLPGVHTGNVEPYFERLAEQLKDKSVPVWDGELYQEQTHGVYTSQAFIKRANRQAETLYHDTEWLCALADTLTDGNAYPRRELNSGWEMLLHNQFHDVLPGTSIRQVFEDCCRDYECINEIGSYATEDAKKRICSQVRSQTGSVVVFNPLAWKRHDLVQIAWSELLEGKTILARDGKPLLTQLVYEGEEKQLLVEVNDVPSLGYQAFQLSDTTPASQPETLQITITPTLLENRFYKITLNQSGQILSIHDKIHAREVLKKPGNILQLFEDRPIGGEAWQMDIFYLEKLQVVDDLQEAVVEETGPLRGTLRLTWQFADTTLTQRITIYHNSRRIDFRNTLDWHEHQVVLKAAFPVDVRAMHATYNIQFGNIERSNNWNTSWDTTHYENPAHKWVDLSEGNYGVALLNDCKYGYDVKDNVLRLTLHRAPIDPDETADQGRHEFTYSLLPHTGTWRNGEVIHEGYALNDSLFASVIPANPTGSLPEEYSWAGIDADNVVLETVKKAEDEDAWIVRVYESKQCRNHEVHLSFGQKIRKAVECNLIELEEQPVNYDDHHICFGIAPYEIKTLKVWL